MSTITSSTLVSNIRSSTNRRIHKETAITHLDIPSCDFNFCTRGTSNPSHFDVISERHENFGVLRFGPARQRFMSLRWELSTRAPFPLSSLVECGRLLWPTSHMVSNLRFQNHRKNFEHSSDYNVKENNISCEQQWPQTTRPCLQQSPFIDTTTIIRLHQNQTLFNVVHALWLNKNTHTAVDCSREH